MFVFGSNENKKICFWNLLTFRVLFISIIGFSMKLWIFHNQHDWFQVFSWNQNNFDYHISSNKTLPWIILVILIIPTILIILCSLLIKHTVDKAATATKASKARALPKFWVTVNPILTRGVDYAHHSTMALSGSNSPWLMCRGVPGWEWCVKYWYPWGVGHIWGNTVCFQVDLLKDLK